MRPLATVITVLILAAASVTAVEAQVFNIPDPGLPDPNTTLEGRIPSPMPAPSQSPAINGPTSQQPNLTPPPEPLPLIGAPATLGAPPSVFQSQTGPSVFQSQTGPSAF